jgi:hypothetical protein
VLVESRLRYPLGCLRIRDCAIQSIRLKPEVIDVFLSLGGHFSCVETSLFVS